jgi:2'-5' RNA ligase
MQNILNYSSTDEESLPDECVERIRKVPHISGNWAAFVFIDVYSPELEYICNNYLKAANIERIERLHVSLSRTGYLKIFQIEKFVENLSKLLVVVAAFSIAFKTISGYSDDENLQHFLALDVKYGTESLKSLVEKIDEVMEMFGFEKYYKDPKFHLSFGYSRTKIKAAKISELNRMDQISAQITVTQIKCKIGNRDYSWDLV